MQEYHLQLNAVPLSYRGVNMQEWWVNIKNNGGSTCARIYNSSQKVVCCTISEKINTLQPVHVCDIHDIDILITELPPDSAVLKPYVDKGIEVM